MRERQKDRKTNKLKIQKANRKQTTNTIGIDKQDRWKREEEKETGKKSPST